MKRKLLIGIPVMLFFCLSSFLFTQTEYPDGIIYNYLEYPSGGVPILNLESFIVYRSGTQILAYNRETKQTEPVGQNVFDIDYSACFLIESQNDTIYYVGSDEGNSSLSYYSFNVNSGQKRFLYSSSVLRNADGFLGIDRLIGIPLVTNDLFQIMRQQGKMWINRSGVHTVNEMRDLLRKTDTADQWGVFDSLEKIAATDNDLWFINDYEELIRFDYHTKTFCCFPVFPVKEFYLTTDMVYYILEDNLYCADWNGAHITKIVDFAPIYIKTDEDALFLQDAQHVVYQLVKVNGSSEMIITKQAVIPDDALFVPGKDAVYILTDDKINAIQWN